MTKTDDRRTDRRRPPALEPLEGRIAPSDLTVTVTADGGVPPALPDVAGIDIGVITVTVTNDPTGQHEPVNALPPVSTLDQIDARG